MMPAHVTVQHEVIMQPATAQGHGSRASYAQAASSYARKPQAQNTHTSADRTRPCMTTALHIAHNTHACVVPVPGPVPVPVPVPVVGAGMPTSEGVKVWIQVLQPHIAPVPWPARLAGASRYSYTAAARASACSCTVHA